MTLVAPEAEHDVPATNGNEYIIAENGSTSGEISWDDNRAFTDGDYVIVIENVDGTESATVSFTIGATETETPEPTATPEPTETQEPTPTATENAPEEAPALAIEQDTYTQSETLSGVNYAGAGWAPGVEITIEVTEPNGSTTVISPVGDPESDIAVDENGEFAGTVTYTTYEDTNGNGQYDVGEPSSAEVLLLVTTPSPRPRTTSPRPSRSRSSRTPRSRSRLRTTRTPRTTTAVATATRSP